jgi:hypothetical protein
MLKKFDKKKKIEIFILSFYEFFYFSEYSINKLKLYKQI